MKAVSQVWQIGLIVTIVFILQHDIAGCESMAYIPESDEIVLLHDDGTWSLLSENDQIIRNENNDIFVLFANGSWKRLVQPIISNNKPKIGVAIYKFDDTFMSYVRNQIESAAKDKIELSVQDSQYDQPKQNDQVDQFITQGMTALAINLVDPSAVSVVIGKAKAKKLPIVLFNREPVAADMAAYDKAYYVGAKAQESGTMEGEIVADYWKANPAADRNKDGKLQYVMLIGDPSNTDAKFRTEYSIKAVEEAGIQVEKLAEDTAMWDRPNAQQKMAAWLTAYKGKIEVVFANNDDMALGAIEALKAAGYFKGGKYMPVVGIDATPPALDALEQGTLLGTVLNDAEKQGLATFDLAYALAIKAKEVKTDVAPLADAEGNPSDKGKYIWVPYVKVTNDNYMEYIR